MNYPQVSRRGCETIESPMRKFLPLLRKAEQEGVYVYKLNVGDPDLETPKVFFKELGRLDIKTLGYAPSPGIPSHTAAWKFYYRQLGVQLPEYGLLPTAGCAEAILFALMAVADPGDEVLVFEPLYVSYRTFARMLGIKLVPITLDPDKNFACPSLEVLKKKITGRTKAIVVVNPDNPTGKLWQKRELERIISLARSQGMFIISDETYREIRFDGKKGESLLENDRAKNICLVCDSLSKRFSMPGARLGCIASFNKEIMKTVLKFAQARLSSGTLEQLAVNPLLLEPKKEILNIRKIYSTRVKLVCKLLRKIKGVFLVPAQGAFYQTVRLPVESAEDFAKFMIEKFRYEGKTVLVTPLEDFYITSGQGKSAIRIACVLEEKKLSAAIALLDRGLKQYKK